MSENAIVFENNEKIEVQEASFLDESFKEEDFVDPVTQPISE